MMSQDAETCSMVWAIRRAKGPMVATRGEDSMAEVRWEEGEWSDHVKLAVPVCKTSMSMGPRKYAER